MPAGDVILDENRANMNIDYISLCSYVSGHM